MTRYTETEDSIRNGALTRIRDALSLTMALPNVSFEPPRDGASQDLPWLRLAVQFHGRRDETIGIPTIRGTAIVSVFVPLRVGVQRLNETVDAVVEAFDSGDMGDVQFERVEAKPGAESGHPGWFMRNVHAHFWVDGR